MVLNTTFLLFTSSQWGDLQITQQELPVPTRCSYPVLGTVGMAATNTDASSSLFSPGVHSLVDFS